MTDTHDDLDAAYERLHRTGPEFDGWLSNHGPMVVEALVRRGRGTAVDRWLDGYVPRLDEAPPVTGRAAVWPDDLGDPRMVGAWITAFTRELADAPWAEVLGRWWPRLLPGVAAGATHGAIRTGHAVEALLTWGADEERTAELAHALAYWAARWQPVPLATSPAGAADADAALAGIPRIDHQDGGVRNRLGQLESLPGWEAAQRALDPAADAETTLRRVVTAAVRRYATHAHGNPVMLVHAATAPNALRRALPALDESLHGATAAADWSAAAAIFAAYSPAAPAPAPAALPSADAMIDAALEHGDEHVIKLADTAVDVLGWDDGDAAARAVHAAVRGVAAV